MKTISIINLKGGVAKTLTAINTAHILSVMHKKRVLIIDNDKQGNASKAFDRHSYDVKTIAEVLTDRKLDIAEVIQKTEYENIDIITANMNLINANLQVLMDSARPQQTRLKQALSFVKDDYDYCIIDNAPDINISTINALVASDSVIIPIKIDEYAFDGLNELTEQIENTKEDLNPTLKLSGCLVTCFQRTAADKQGKEWLKSNVEYPIYETHIRYSEKVTESTFAKTPIAEYSRRSGAAIDYIKFVEEYLQKEQEA